MAIKTLPKALLNIVEKQPNRIAMRRKDYGIWHDITWTEYLENVKHVTLGLHALGVKYQEHVAIIGENRPEWLYSALGIVCAGGAWVGVGVKAGVGVRMPSDENINPITSPVRPSLPRSFWLNMT